MTRKKISLALLLLTFISISVPMARSQDEEIPEIVVTASRYPQPASETPDNITVLTSDEINRLPAHDLSESLNFRPGLNIQGRGSFGQPSSISIQGSNTAHVRIMVDGVLLNTQGNANANPSLIPLENVERIEIIKGTGSAAWGSSLGGIINVITKSPPALGEEKFTGNLTLTGSGGAIGYWKESLKLSGRTGPLGYLFNESHQDSNGNFRNNSNFLNNDTSGKIIYDLGEHADISGSYHYTRQVMGGYEFPTLGYGEDYAYIIRYGTLGLNVRPSDPASSGIDFNATLKTSNQDSTLTRFAVPSKALISEVQTKNIFSGLDLVSHLRLRKEHQITLGLDSGQDKLDSDQTAEKEKMSRYGIYANHHWLINEDWSLVTGARHDDNTAYGSQFSPSAGLGYDFSKKVHLKMSAARAFNAPPLIYRYLSGNPFVIANEDLRAERAWVYEAGLETNPLPDLQLKMAAYRAEVTDLVSVVMISAVPLTFQAQNLDKTRRQGLEAEAIYTFTKNLTASTGWDINRVQNRLTGEIIQSNGAARTTYSLGLDYQYEKLLNCSLKGKYYFWNEPDASDPKDRRFIWDARVNYDLKPRTNRPASVFINIFNIFDRPNYYNKLLPNSGRRVEVGVSYKF